jgi:methyl-accepting chemotaxis protein
MKKKMLKKFPKISLRLSKSIGRRITVMSVCCILVTVTITALILFNGSSSQTSSILSSDTKTSMTSFRSNISDMGSSAVKCATELAKDDAFVTSLQQKDKSAISMTIGIAARGLGYNVDFVTVTDASGKVLTCTNSDQSGESLAEQKDVKAALSGAASDGMLLQGADVKLAVRASAPVESNGNVIAVISAGYDLSENVVLKTLKQNTGCDFSIFLGDASLNTTLMQGGKRATGIKAAQNITDQVLKQKQTYSAEADVLGSQFYARYEPLKDADGKTVGMYFVGKPTAEITASRQRFLLLTILITALLSVASIFAFNIFSKKKIAAPIRSMSEMAAQLAAGNLTVSGTAVTSNDEIGLLAKSLQTMAANLRRYISDITEQLARISQGDMTSEFELDYIGDFAPIREALLKISESMNTTLQQIDRSAMQVSSGSGQVSSISQALAQGVSKQVGSVNDLSHAIGDVSQKAEETASMVSSVTSTVSKAAEDVGKSNHKADDMLNAMQEIKQSSDKIEQIIKSIDSIAFQTNILALNAAVEAARAGSAGKGFAVVADEVRRLAAKSAEASKQTAALIRTSQEKVHVGFGLAQETAESAQQINQSLQEVIHDISGIDQASKAQTAAVAQISDSIGKVSEVVQTNSATSEECAAASEELSGQADLLRSEVGKFHLKDTD